MGGAALNETSSDDIEKRLEQINETLSSISAKEVLFIIILSFLSMFVALILCLQIIERRKKRKQANSVPQSIVIQPNNVKGEKSGRHDKSKMSSGYEKDVLPSKSMKMKVAISPSMTTAKKGLIGSKETVTEDSQVSKTESSKVESSKIETPVKKLPMEPDVTTAVEHLPTAPLPAPALPATPAPASSASTAQSASTSQSTDSVASFTVPEDAATNRTKSPASIKENPPATPTATTLSGTSVSAAPSEISSKPTSQVATAKDITAPAKSPMTPARTPDPPIIAPPAVPLVTSTPPPMSEKKVDSLFPNGCGSCV